ncbi:MAG: hypothetical protein ACRDDZ_13740 [Marinifilaceae bacterium]
MTFTADTLTTENKRTRLFTPKNYPSEHYFKEDTPSGADCTNNYHRSSWNDMQIERETLHNNEKISVKKVMLWR